MTPVVKILIGGTLLVLICAAVIVPTVIVVINNKDNGNTTTTRATTVASTSLNSVSSTTSRRIGNTSDTISSGTTSAGGSTSSAASLSSSRSTTVAANTTRATTTLRSTTTTVNTSLFSTSVSAALTRQSGTICALSGCSNGNNFYQAILINITVTGPYVFYSQSTLDTYAFLYSPSFDPRYTSVNVLTSDDDTNGNTQYRISWQLTMNTAYILVSTTYDANKTGSIVVVATGPGPIVLTPINVSSTAESATFQTNTSVQLTNSSSKFCRSTPCTTPNFYYQAVTFNVSTAGIYNIRSISSSPFDTYGYLYANSFIPTNITQNMMLGDDDGAGDTQFLLASVLAVEIRYIVIVTTYNPNTLGSTTVSITGPGNTTLIT